MNNRIKAFKEAEENIANSAYIYDSFIPAMYGGFAGDALGARNQKPGAWPDDTFLTLCLIENIIENGSPKNLTEKTVKYGKSSRLDAKNGALMRIAPLAFIAGCSFDFLRLVKAIEDYAEITNAHPRSTLGCIIYCAFLFRLMHNDDFKNALNIVADLCHKNLANTKYKDEFIHYNRIFNKSIIDLPEKEIISGGDIAHSLEASLWCCFKTDNFKDAVLKAVNLGGNTGAAGAITGTIAGTFYKMDAIPKEWLNVIARKDDIDNLLNEFCEKYMEFRKKYFKPEE